MPKVKAKKKAQTAKKASKKHSAKSPPVSEKKKVGKMKAKQKLKTKKVGKASKNEKTASAPVPFVAPPPIKIKKEHLELRSKLLEMLEEARDHMNDKMRDATTRDLAHLQDVSDVAADASEGDLALRLAENVRVEAAEIERAIQKIDNGTYGLCEACEIAIPEERMHFLPFATHCIKCQELQDLRRKRRNDSLQGLDGEEDMFPDDAG